MKQRKRIAALLAAGVMLFSSLPTNALGAERQTTGSLCEHHPEHTAECGYAEGTPCTFVCENCNLQSSGESTRSEDAVTVESVQAMIDSLPGKDEISGGNGEDVQAQLTAIDEAIAELTDEETAQLDMTRYLEAADALEGLHVEVAPLSNAVMLADYNGPAIVPGTDHLTGGQASNIYFGTYQQSSNGSGGYNTDPIKWRVLDNADGKLFLLSDQNLDVFQYHTEQESVTWEKSTMRSWLNGLNDNTGDGDTAIDYTGDNFIGTAFSDKEQRAIANTNVVNDDDGNTEGGNNTTDKIFLLSIAEAKNSSYFADNNSRIATNTAYVADGGEIGSSGMYGVGADDYWWLRSSGENSERAASVDRSGGMFFEASVNSGSHAVRPAFNLNLTSALFTTAAVDGKPGDGLQEVKDYTGNEWKLTLYDSDRDGFNAIKKDDNTITYSGAQTGDNEYISVLIQDKTTKEYTHYGRLAKSNGSGDVDVILPFDMTDKTLYVFNEQYNGDKMTDYASELQEVDLSQNAYEEQFTSLTPGETYWFDLSDVDIPGMVNTGNGVGAVSVPDTTLTWVLFTYAGTIDAYVLNSSSSGQTAGSAEAAGTTDSTGQYGYTYAHSLFIADYNLTHTVSWDDLDDKDIIFGTTYSSGGVDYILRAPSAGSNYTDDGENERGTPENNEWDAILNKGSGYIKNWQEMGSWGQDTCSSDASPRATRGYYSARYFTWASTGLQFSHLGFRPVLELPNLDTLNSDSLQVVEVEMNGGKVGATSTAVEGPVNLVVKSNENFTAPSSDGLTAPAGKVFDGWLGDDDQTYAPGDAVPASVATLTAKWKDVPVSYISYYWDENAQKLVRSDTETTGPYTLLTADNAATDWTAGWYVVEGEVNLPARVTVTGEVHLILKDGCHLNAGSGGIQVQTGNSLTIYAQSEDESTMGRLTATGGNNEAGIGGGSRGAGEGITINGGTVTATGGDNGAGIGGGFWGVGEGITINGGTVTATGGDDAAGIGGGYQDSGEGITINGGTVTATGGDSGAGIGGGLFGDGKDITINGGKITVEGRKEAAGIGGGHFGESENIAINDGKITATGGSNAAGIGGGSQGDGKGITINGGTVTATGGDSGAGIGGGFWGVGEGITINGGTVTATGGNNGAGIGGGSDGSGNNITITNGSVKASSISITPTDGNGNSVYLAKLEVQSGINEVTLDSGTAPKTFKRAGDHPDGDTAFYLYLTGQDHEITASNTKYKAIWNGRDGFDIKLAASAPTVTIAETTASSITVEELADKETYGGAEYSLDGKNWQTSNVLTDLHSNTTYTVYARYKGDTIYATSDAGKLENVSTNAANYTITIPAEPVEAGNSESKAELKPSNDFDLGYGGTATVKVKENSGVDNDGNLTLTRQNDTKNYTITSALLVNNTALGNINKSVATFTMNNKTPVSVSFAKPTETDIPAGTYSGTITFVVSYSE